MDSTDGRWDGVITAPGNVFAVHGTLLNNGHVLLFSGIAEGGGFPLETYEWDPSTNDITTAETATMPVDLFCCHHVTLEDGRVLTAGGAGALSGGSYIGDWGISAICTYDAARPLAERWQKIGDMDAVRWYPTLVTLPNGDVVVVSGITRSSTHVSSAELFTAPFTGPGYATQSLSGGDKTFPSYPGMLLTKGGKIFHCATTWDYRGSSTDEPIATFSFRRTGDDSAIWTDEATGPAVANREEGTFVLLPPAQDGKILILGGGFYTSHGHKSGSELASAEILDTQASPVSWRRIDDMSMPRVNPSVVLLPDGKVLAIGGHDSYKWSSSLVASNQAEIYDPVLDFWTTVATMGTLRIYHSTALLLPDGRVLTAGGVGAGNQQNMEFYRPPYFFNGDRPTLTSISRDDGPDDELAYGGEFFIDTPEAASIRKVALMRPGSMTHHTDTEQRYVALQAVPVSDNRLRVGVINDPTVAPPGYYMLWIVDEENRPCLEAKFVRLTRKQCRIITDRSHVSNDEVDPSNPTTFDDAFYVVMDGFVPSELGITTATPTLAELEAWAPQVTFTTGSDEFASEITDIDAVPQELLLEDDTLPEGVKQKFTFKYRLIFASNEPFLDTKGNPIELQVISVRAEKNAYICNSMLQLTNQPNPYIVDGATHWLSTDVRVFQISAGDERFDRTIGNNGAAALAYIQGILNDFNANPALGTTRFESISTDQADSQLELARSKDGSRVFNFAVAKVSYRGRTLEAEDVRVFFRMFTTAATGLDFRVGSTYRRRVNTAGDPIPVLGVRGGEVVTIPFFAEERVNTAIDAMDEQKDGNNRKTISATAGATTSAFFGCWLDFNQTPQRFPINPGGIGPFSSGLKSIQELIRGRHQCLVAEIHFAPDPINEGDTPAGNDNLSQRNLAIVESNNPGNAATHTVQHTFEIEANEAVGLDTRAKALEYFLLAEHGEDHAGVRTNLHRLNHDELMIQWHNLPRNATATLFVPDLNAENIRYLTALKIGPERTTVVDEHTLELLISDVTYLSLPPAPTNSIPALLSIELPDDVKTGQRFNVTVSQVSGVMRKILGSFEFVIPVTSAERVLAEDIRTLSVFKHINNAIPVGDHWKAIFDRQLNHLAARVTGLGGNPELVNASPDGDGGVAGIVEDEESSTLCRVLGIVVAVLVGVMFASIGSGSVVVGGLSLFALVAAIFYWVKRCVVSFSLALQLVSLGLLIGLALMQAF